MILIRGLLDRVILLLGVVGGGCIPSFVNQYQQRVGGRLDQALQDISPFQQIADRYHGGSMDSLIQHHLRSNDPTFYEEGAALQVIMDSIVSLRHMLAQLDTDVAHQLIYLSLHYDTKILQSTLNVFEPAFMMNTDGLLIAAFLGATFWLLFLSMWRLTAWVLPSAPSRAG